LIGSVSKAIKENPGDIVLFSAWNLTSLKIKVPLTKGQNIQPAVSIMDNLIKTNKWPTAEQIRGALTDFQEAKKFADAVLNLLTQAEK
jgi:hypothetical protein